MSSRRDFLKLLSAAGTLVATGAVPAPAHAASTGRAPLPATGADDRAFWCMMAAKLANPVLGALAERRLKATMPVEARHSEERAAYAHLEALGRTLMGLAPWLECRRGLSDPENTERLRCAQLARSAIDAATDPASPDFVNFSKGGQPLVDAAFLAQAILRAPEQLWAKLEPRVQRNLVAGFRATRAITPPESNWQLFAAMVEACLHRVGEPRDDHRLFEPIRKHRAWYIGDGIYGDGPSFRWDYYNAFVIQPMLVEVLDVVGGEGAEWQELRELARSRLTRFAAIEERLIAPDGSYPAIGRSITYRCGAFQGLALAAWRQALPAEVAPGQARAALTAVIRRTLEAPGTFDSAGWLRLGLAGHQPGLAENYISTGSLYLCSAALLPLGLPPEDPFWADPAQPTTSQRVWSGVDHPADHALATPDPKRREKA